MIRPYSSRHSASMGACLRPLLLLTGFGLLWLLAGCAAARQRAAAPHPDPGRSQFESYCAACHLSGEAPPLDGSDWVKGSEDRLINIVLHGLRGGIKVDGKIYNQEMPAVGQVLTDAQIASLLSFVRRQFGGAGTPVLPAAVARVRAATRNRESYWTVDELSKER